VIVAIGDSITAGQHLHPASAWPFQLDRERYEIMARGVPGDTTRLGLERFPRDVQTVCPEMVIIQFGHNDANRWDSDRGLPRVSQAAYKANLIEMVDRCRAFGAIPLLCTLTPTFRSDTHSDDCVRYDRIVRRVADEEGVPLIDVRAAFEADERVRDLLLEDGLHLSVEGHRTYAAAVEHTLAEQRP
jgi:lysophospholipase L1-like esterase